MDLIFVSLEIALKICKNCLDVNFLDERINFDRELLLSNCVRSVSNSSFDIFPEIDNSFLLYEKFFSFEPFILCKTLNNIYFKVLHTIQFHNTISDMK